MLIIVHSYRLCDKKREVYYHQEVTEHGLPGNCSLCHFLSLLDSRVAQPFDRNPEKIQKTIWM